MNAEVLSVLGVLVGGELRLDSMKFLADKSIDWASNGYFSFEKDESNGKVIKIKHCKGASVPSLACV